MPTLDRPRCERLEQLIPFPFTDRTQTVLGWLQVFAPIVGLGAAVWHAVVYGIAPGTIAVAVVLAVLTGAGVTVGFHRLFTHRSFEAVGWLRNTLAILGSMAGQHNLFQWVSQHRKHHQFTDRDGDPHSPNPHGAAEFATWRQALHAHFGWLLTDRLDRKSADMIPDLTSDPALCRIQRLHAVLVAVGILVPGLLCWLISGTWQAFVGGILWGGFARMLLTTQSSLAVNSVCHLWGSRPFESRDESRNNAAVAWLSLGEGWHNNHHAFPTSARHGLEPHQPDASWGVIRLFERWGLAWNVKLPTSAQIAAKRRPTVEVVGEERRAAWRREAPVT